MTLKVTNSLEDFLLFAQLKRKDKDAFIKFYDSNLDKIYRYIYFKVGQKEDAEDLTSASFLKLWNAIQEGKIIEYSTLRSLMYTIARNIVIDHYRKTSTMPTVPIQDEIEIDGETIACSDQLVSDTEDVRDALDREIDLDQIKERLLEMKDEYREIIVLRFIEGLSAKEIAKILNKTPGNVRILSHRAIKSLKEMISDERK